MENSVYLENELIYLGLLDKAREIYSELGERAVLSYIKSSHRLLSKVYHPDLNPEKINRAKIVQQRLNTVSQLIGGMKDEELIELIKKGTANGNIRKKKVLIVEDEPGLQELYKDVLLMEGYDVRVAVDGNSGYETYCLFEPDLVMTDVIMPKINGFELVRKIREKKFHVKVIYISGFFGIESLKNDLQTEIGTFGYPTLSKPFKISEMLNIINDYLDKSEGVKFYKGI